MSGINPYKLLGISSHENDYRLSWALNRKLGLKFRKTDNLIPARGNADKEFSVFKSEWDNKSLSINLISNRCPDGFLIKEMKNIDFVLQVFGEINQADFDKIVAKIKTIDLVSAVFEISPDKLKKRGNLLPE